jgi:hypothetical protein
MRHAATVRVILAFVAGASCAALLFAAFGRPKPAAKVFVVQKIYWHYSDRSVPFHESEPSGAGFPQKAFADRTQAEAHCRTLNLAARPEYGTPFPYGRGWGHSFPSLRDYTSTPTGEFIAWLEAEGVAPPAGQKEAWEAVQKLPEPSRRFDQGSYSAWWSWWEESAGWTEVQRNRIWDKLDRVRFYEVVEVES